MSENIKKWYVLRAIGGKEKKVKEYIDSEVVRLKLEDYISQVLIPTEKVYQIRAGKKISKERTFLSGICSCRSCSFRRNTSFIKECAQCNRISWVSGW
jgi:hypothetical protein